VWKITGIKFDIHQQIEKEYQRKCNVSLLPEELWHVLHDTVMEYLELTWIIIVGKVLEQ